MKRILQLGLFIFGTMSFSFPAVAQRRPPVPPINLTYLRIDFTHPSARPASLGGAFIAAAQDESAAPINPSGLTFLKSPGATLNQRHVTTHFEEPAGSIAGPSRLAKFETIHFNQTMVGVFLPLKRVTLALFRHIVFDSRFNFETNQFVTLSGPLSQRQALGGLGNFPGRRVNLDLEMVNDAFSIAIRVHKRLSIGFSIKTSVMNFRIDEFTFLDPIVRQGLPPGDNRAETTYWVLTLDERNVQPSYSFGALGKLSLDQLFWGAIVDLNPKFVLQSQIFLPEYNHGSDTFPSEDVENTTFHVKVPDRFGLGLYYVATPGLRFSFDVVRLEYSELLEGNDLNAVEDDVYDAESDSYQDPDGRDDLTLEDATEIHFGMEYLFRIPQLGVIPLRLGVYTNPGHRIHSASDEPDLRRLFPKAKDNTHFTFGLGLILNSYLKVDLGLNKSRDNLEFFASTLFSIPY